MSKSLSKELRKRQHNLFLEKLGKPYDILKHIHQRKVKPEKGDWLAENYEEGQFCYTYLSDNSTCTTKKSIKIYIYLLGEFSKTQMQILENTMVYIEAFYSVKCVIYGKIEMALIPSKYIRKNNEGITQIYTRWILQKFKKNMLDDGSVYMAISSYDLYSEEDDPTDYVFGEAYLQSRITVWSIYRNEDPFANYTLYLKRTISTALHEIGHTFGIQHCICFECLMNGSNSMEESDKGVLYLCPNCLKKLMWNKNIKANINFIKKRFINLKKCCHSFKFTKEADFYLRTIHTIENN